MYLLEEIYQNIRWECKDFRPTLVCLDASWCEILKWDNRVDQSSQILYRCSLISLEEDSAIEVVLAEKKFERVLFLVSSVLPDRIHRVKDVLQRSFAPECVLICSVSSLNANLQYKSEKAYEDISDILEPAKATIYFFPYHSIPLLHSPDTPKKVDLRILASNEFKKLKPLSLTGLSIDIDKLEEYKSIYDIPAADLPENTKSLLKHLAHEIAEVLVFDLGLDPTNSVYSLGKTSSLIGHNLLGVVDTLSKHITMEEFYQRLFPLDTGIDYKSPLKHASLILVDRWEDLFTPSASTGTHPLAHRIINTLKMAESSQNAPSSSIDVALQPGWIKAFRSLNESDSSNSLQKESNSLQNFNAPMNAVGSSAFKTLPSLCYTSKDPELTSTMRYKIMACNEEEGRSTLCQELKDQISKEKGNLPPPKKRGLGAEVSALVQSLLESPGSYSLPMNPVFRTSYNPIVCCKSERLIALSYAVIDAMQRSSPKQFISLCNWKAAFDDRIIRENDMIQNMLQYDEFDVASAAILKYFLKNSASKSQNNSEKVSPIPSKSSGIATRSKSKLKTPSKDQQEEEKSEPVDVIHILLMTIQLLSLSRYRNISPSFVGFLLSNIAEYALVEASDEELEYWKLIGILNESNLKEILEWKIVYPTSDLDKSEIVKIISLILESSLKPLLEISQMYNIFTQKLAKKKFPIYQKNSFDYLADFYSGDRPGVGSPNANYNGLLARIVQDCLTYKVHNQQYSPTGSGSSSSPLVKLLEHIENPFQQLAKKGLGLLSRGLGRLGFGTEDEDARVEHPGNQEVIVLFVIGGISYKEVGQVQAVLQEYTQISGNKIILMSNNIIGNEELLQLIFS